MKPWLWWWLLCACALGVLAQADTLLRRTVEAAWERSLERSATGGQGEVARAGLDSPEAGSRAAKLRVAGAVRKTQWQAQAGAAELLLAEVRAAGVRSLANDVERRVAAGDLARSDSLALRAERLAAEAEVAGARQRLDSVRAAWRLLTGM